MKKYILVLSVVIFVLTLFSISLKPLYLTDPITTAYVYPITPKKTPEEWKKLSVMEMFQVCEIPEYTLKRLTTEALLETCVTYPLFVNYLGIMEFIEMYGYKYNGITELVNRDDIGAIFYEYYKNLNVDEIVNPDFNSDLNVLNLEYIEVIISDKKVLRNMNMTTRHNLALLCLDNIMTDRKYTDGYASSVIDYNLLIIGNIMITDNIYFSEFVESEMFPNFDRSTAENVILYLSEIANLREFTKEDLELFLAAKEFPEENPNTGQNLEYWHIDR